MRLLAVAGRVVSNRMNDSHFTGNPATESGGGCACFRAESSRLAWAVELRWRVRFFVKPAQLAAGPRAAGMVVVSIRSWRSRTPREHLGVQVRRRVQLIAAHPRPNRQPRGRADQRLDHGRGIQHDRLSCRAGHRSPPSGWARRCCELVRDAGFDPVASGGLGRVERAVGLADQLVGFTGVVGECRDAEAGGQRSDV